MPASRPTVTYKCQLHRTGTFLLETIRLLEALAASGDFNEVKRKAYHDNLLGKTSSRTVGAMLGAFRRRFLVPRRELPPVSLVARRHILAWLQDRFRLRFQLTPGNIERVVCERLLKKRPAGVTSLQSLYERSAGVLTASAMLQGVAGGRIPTALTPERFIAFYPLLPYHISLLQEAFSTLRQRGGGSEEVRRRLAGRERSMLQTIHAVLRGEGNISAFADRTIGELITFDVLYDAVGSELSIIQSDHHDAITNRVTGVAVEGGLPAPQVAKALFLLQQVGDWLPTSLANVAAVLCPRVDAHMHAHREAVRHTLEALKAAGWVVEEQGIYRFPPPRSTASSRRSRRASRPPRRAKRRR